jgi:glycosyltransferase involved in cell wall biosynthesis
LGVILGPFFSRYLVAKYASNWQGYPGEIWSYKIQRALLRSRWWRGPVTVYGLWANQPAHVIPFFTSIMTSDQMERAHQVARGKTVHTPLRVLFVGRLTKEKNVDILLSSMANLNTEGIPVIGKIVGVGGLRDALEAQTLQTGLQNCVTFTGGVTFDQVLGFYEEADVLVLVSEVEGWPKAIAEAMAFGLVCIGSQRGWVPEMLAEGRGLVIPPGDTPALTNALREIARSPEMYTDISVRAAKWAEKYSLEGLREALRNLLEERWKITIPVHPQL